MAAVILERIRKVYPPGIAAVRELSLHVADGEFLVLLGPSGCGKTTTLRLIAGLERPDAGSVHIDGRDVTHLPPRQRDTAMVFQRPAVYPHLSVRDNLAFGLRLQRSSFWPFRRTDEPEIAGRVAEVARLLQLDDLLDRRPGQLSGGQQQRVALGRAVVRRPAVFLLDEPLSSLDSRLRAEMRRELHLLHKRLPATMVYVTHDPVEALALADRVAILDDGTLQQAGAPQTVYNRPCNRRVAGFFGSPPMNLLDGLIVETAGRPVFRSAEGAVTLPLSAEVAGPTKMGQAVTLGVRPEDLVLRPGQEGVTLSVVLVEPMGSNHLVTLEHAEVRLTVLTGRETWTDGQNVSVEMNMDRIHLFDGATGQALGHGSRTG